MRIALAQINTRLADFDYNAEKIISQIKVLSEKKAELIIFPEACLFGYHPFDLLERETLVDDQLKALQKIIKNIPAKTYVILGGFSKNKNKKGRPYFNSAFLCSKNKIIKTFNKELLPTGDVFDEARFIEKGALKDNFFKLGSKKFFLTICEDIWAWPSSKNAKSDYAVNPLKKIKPPQIDLVINLSASPYFSKKLELRKEVAHKTAKHFKAPLLYVNLVGAQDEIIYDGRSFLITPQNKTLLQLQGFSEDCNVFDLNNFETWSPSVKADSALEELRKALVLGLKDFALKTGMSKVHLGLSGGIDSALVAALAVDAFGPSHVKLFALPTQFNSEKSMSCAKQLAKNLNVSLQVVSIDSTFEFIKNILDSEFNVSHFGLMHENLQSRLRGLFLMAYSNLTGSMLLTTGNKDEYATGYATLYGDMCGGLAPIGDLTKKQIVDLCKHYNSESELIPRFIIERPPSAELRPNQKDEDSLPEYNLLDKSVVQLVEKKKNASSSTDKWLIQQLMKTEFKRWQAPPILKVSEHSFGRGRRYPIAHQARK